MKFTKLSIAATFVAAVLAIAGVTTASAAPAPPAYQGVDQGIGYTTFLSPAARAVTTTVDTGTFTLAGNTVTLTNPGGAVVAQIPLVYEAAGQRIVTTPAVEDDGRTLVLVPDAALNAAAADINSQQWFFAELQRASLGALVGAIIGGVIGFFFFIGGAIPGALIGAGIGLLVAGGQPLIDSGVAYFSGRP